MTDEIDADARRITATIALVFAGAMHLVVGGFVAMSPLVAPAWVVAALVVGWLALAVLIWRWRSRRPLATLFVPFVGAGALWAVLRIGERVFDWSAT